MSTVNPQEKILEFVTFLVSNPIDSRKTAYSPNPHRASPHVSFYQQTFILLTQNQNNITMQMSTLVEVNLKQRIQLIKSKTDGIIGFFRYLFCLSIRIDLKEEVKYLEVTRELIVTIREAAAKRPKERVEVETPSTPQNTVTSTVKTRKQSLQSNQVLAQLAQVIMKQPPTPILTPKKSPSTPLVAPHTETQGVKIQNKDSIPKNQALDVLAQAIINRTLTPAIPRQIVATIDTNQNITTENDQKEDKIVDENPTSMSAPPSPPAPPPAPALPAAIFSSNVPPPPPMNNGQSTRVIDPKTAHANREKLRLERELKDRLNPANLQSVIPLNDEVRKEKEKLHQSLKKNLETSTKLSKADPNDEQAKNDIQKTQAEIAQVETELKGKTTFFNSVNKRREMTQQAQKLTTEELKSLLGMYFETVEGSFHDLQEECKNTYKQAKSLIKSTLQSHAKSWVDFFSEQRGRLDIYLEILNQRMNATAKEPIYEAKAYDPEAKARASTKLEASVKSTTSVIFDFNEILAVKLKKAPEIIKEDPSIKAISSKDIRGFSLKDLTDKLSQLKPRRSIRSV